MRMSAIRDQKLAEIAKGILGIPSWVFECPGEDQQQVLLVDLKQALQLAYLAGQDDESKAVR